MPDACPFLFEKNRARDGSTRFFILKKIAGLSEDSEMEAEQERKKEKKIGTVVPNPKKNPARAGLSKHCGLGLVLVRATPPADFAAVFGVELCLTIAAIVLCVTLS